MTSLNTTWDDDLQKTKRKKKRKNPIAHAQAVAKTHAEMNV